MTIKSILNPLGATPVKLAGHRIFLLLAVSALLVAAAAARSTIAQATTALAAAKKLHDQGKFELSLDAYETILVDAPDEPRAYTGAGKCLLALGRAPDALALMQKAVKQPKADGENYSVLGQAIYFDACAILADPASQRAAFVSAVLADAEKSLLTALLKDPKLFLAHYYLGKVLVQSGRPEEAGKPLLEAARLAPPQYKAWAAGVCGEAAAAADAGGDAEAAVAAWKLGFKLDPSNTALFGQIWATYGAKKERQAEGVGILTVLAAAKPSEPLPNYYLGYFHQAMGKKAEARKAYEKVLKSQKGKKFAMAWALLGEIYGAEDQDLAKAEKYCFKALELDPNNAKAESILSWIVGRAIKDRDQQRAVELTRKILKAQPKNGKQWGVLGSFYKNAGRLRDARAAYQKGVEFAPKDPGVLCGAAMVYNDLREYDTAVALWKRALAEDPKHVLTLMNLGYRYRMAGRNKEAAGLFSRVLAIQPNNMAAERALASVQ